ncbi:MAG: nucleotide exchange factor GrpE [Candidatus Saccharimonadales bacterium]
MKDKNAKLSKKEQELQARVDELTTDVQRLRADFENYHKRAENEKGSLRELTKAATILKLLPVIDNIDRAISHTPEDLADNKWVQGIVSLGKNLEKSLKDLGLERIPAAPGTTFDPNLHEAISVEDGDGEHEVVAQELRAGFKLGHQVIRPSMVKVKREDVGAKKIVKEQLKTEPKNHEIPED